MELSTSDLMIGFLSKYDGCNYKSALKFHQTLVKLELWEYMY